MNQEWIHSSGLLHLTALGVVPSWAPRTHQQDCKRQTHVWPTQEGIPKLLVYHRTPPKSREHTGQDCLFSKEFCATVQANLQGSF
ncbi:unnamed protein product [Gulo gulo]|uniref:Secreted protein n=1 Tax=Gulo gulo TaxID=48420 RepID=A0A9X9LDX0_GULGU|nr:unnamed protein product [Gulo gulo]